MTKKDKFINFVEHQTGVKLENNPANILNKKRNILHTEITKSNMLKVLTLLNSKKIRYEQHVGESYFIYL